MEKKGTSWMLLVGALLLASAAAAEEEKRVESVERFSTKLLAEAEKEVGRIVGLMHRSLDGNAKAQYELGTLILEEGPTYIRKNVSREDREGYYAAHREVDTAALKWMVRSARQGHGPAVSRVTDLYLKIVSDHRVSATTQKKYLVQAFAWDKVLFRMTGVERVTYHSDIKFSIREVLEARMTDDQVAEAERLSHQIEREIKANGRPFRQ